MVHAAQTRSRGTSTTRSKSRSNSGSGRWLFDNVVTPLPIDAVEVGVELIETQLPRATLFHHPTFRRLEWRGCEPVRPDSSSLLRRHQPAPLEHAEVLRERRQRHAKGLGQLARRRRSSAESLDYEPAGWIREGVKDEIQVRNILRHVPYFALSVPLRSSPDPRGVAGGHSVERRLASASHVPMRFVVQRSLFRSSRYAVAERWRLSAAGRDAVNSALARGFPVPHRTH